MKYENLKKKGTMIAMHDSYEGFAYICTIEGWLCNGNFYTHSIHPNLVKYTGQTGTHYICPRDSKDFIKFLWNARYGFFDPEDITEEGRQILTPEELAAGEF